MSQGLCTSCGAAVNLASGQDEINCTYCGTLVKRPEAEAQFAEVKNSRFGGTLLIAETAQEGGSYEEALNYYNKVIEQQPDFADAWLNKGICMVRNSKIGDLKIPEAISSWKAAIKFAKNPDAMKKRVATEINSVVSDFYPVLENHFLKFHTVDNSFGEHQINFLILESALSFALELNPTATIARNGISLCDRFVTSIKTSFSSENDNDIYGALTAASMSGRVEKLTNEIAATLQETRNKYELVLANADPEFAKQIAVRTKQIAIRDAKKAGTSAREAGDFFAAIGGLAFCFLVVSVIWALYNLIHKNQDGERLFGIPDIVRLSAAIGTLIFASVLQGKKQIQRDNEWLKELPACFGTADLKLAMHPTEEEHFHKLLESSLKAGFDYLDIRNEIEKYLKERGCTEEHLQEQLSHFDVLTKFQPDVATQVRRKNEARKAARENKKNTQPTVLPATESQKPAKAKPSEFRIENRWVITLGIWCCRIVGILGCLGAIGLIINAMNGNAKPDDPGVGGCILMFLLFGGITVCGFLRRKKIKQ